MHQNYFFNLISTKIYWPSLALRISKLTVLMNFAIQGNKQRAAENV
jgi:hypothetical protein